MSSSPSTPSPTPNSAGNYRSTPAGSVDRNTCFRCQQKGHWVKDCAQKSAGKQSKPSPPAPTTPTPIDGRHFPVKLCPCGEGPCVVRTSRTERNPGRNFYCCPATGCMNCGLFQWCDEVSSDEGSNSNIPMSPYPTCSCGAGKCHLVMKAGRKAFVCHIKRGQGACDFFQWQDSLVKEDDLFDGRSNESPQPVSDNDERVGFEVGAEQPSAIWRLDFDDEWIGGDHNGLANSPLIAPRDKGKALLSAVTPDLQECGSGPFNVPRDKGKALLCDEGFQAEVGPHKGMALLSDEGFQAEVAPHSNIRMPDLQECHDDVDLAVEQLSFGTRAEKVPVSTSSKGSEIASFNLSSKNDPVSSYGERFQAAEFDCHPVVIEVEKAFEDIVLSVNMKKGLVSSFGEGFQGKVGHHPSTEKQNLHGGEAGNGSDVEWIDLTEGEGGDGSTKDVVKKAMLLSSTDGFKVEEEAQHHPIESFYLHEVGDNVNRPDCQPSSGKGSQSEVGCHGKAIGVENAHGLEMPLQTSSNEKSRPPLHGKGTEGGKMHGTEEPANVSCLAPQERKYFQSGKAKDWMKVFSNSQICFKCGKSGHSKEDCNRR